MHYSIKAFSLLFILVFLSCSSKDIEVHTGNALGTFYNIKYERFNINRLKLQDGIDSIFFEINNSLSTYMPNSDISRINNGDTLLRVDNHFKKVYEKNYNQGDTI